MKVWDSIVIGAGQAGLSAAFFLKHYGADFLVLDANDHAGGAWQHRWDALTMNDVHGVSDLPELGAPAISSKPANQVIPAYFQTYEAHFQLPVLRPVRVTSVTSQGNLLRVHAGEQQWLTRTLVNATGTWTRPYVPYYPGVEDFQGEQFHTQTFPGPEHFAGKRVLIVGAGASAVQFIGMLAPIAHTVWATRNPPRWRDSAYDNEARVKSLADIQQRTTAGEKPRSIVAATGLTLRAQEQKAKELGAYDHPRRMFSRLEKHGARWADGSYEPVDVILWATGFHYAITHLAPLHLKSKQGGIALVSTGRNVQGATRSQKDPRINFVGYGPSASTIGASRAGRTAALSVARYLGIFPLHDESGGELKRPATTPAVQEIGF